MEEEKFTPDSEEFAGYGAETAKETPVIPEEASPEAANEAEEKPAETKPEEKQETNQETKAEEKPAETKPDPLDLPIEDFAKVDLGLGDAPVDKAVMQAFGEQCVKLRLTPNQAAALAQFQLSTIEKARQELTAESIKTLQKEWGKDAGANQQALINLVSKVDQAMGNNEFSQALEESGVACYASFARGLFQIAKMLGEDSLGAHSQGVGSGKSETALEGLQAVFGAARGRN